MRGPAPLPTALRVLSGSRRPLNEDEPQPEKTLSLPHPPPEVGEDPDALGAWYDLGQQLMGLGVLTEVDIDGFTALCMARSQYFRLQRRANAMLDGQQPTDNNRLTLASAFRMVHDAHLRYRDMMREFGLTPASRSRVAAKKADKPKSTFGRIAAGRRNPTAA